MRRLWMAVPVLVGIAALLLNGLAVASARGGDEQPTRVAVIIENYAFEPDPVIIKTGSTVVWTNRDEVLHTVVSNEKLFSSPELEVNRSFQFTFKKAGTFAYFCSLHPEMKGKVVVK